MIKSLRPISTRTVVAVLAITICLANSASAQKSKSTRSKAPAKVVRLQPPPPAAAPPKTVGLAIERYVNNIDVAADGTSVQTWSVLQRFQSEMTIPRFKKVERVFNRDLAEIEVFDTFILKRDGRKIVVPPAAVQTKRTPQTEAAPSFSSLMMVEINFDGIEVGDAAQYSMRLRTKKTHFEKYFDSVDYLTAIYDWKYAEINLSAPIDYPIYTEAIDLDGGRLPDSNGRAHWQWKKTDHKALELETLMLDFIDSSPRVIMTSFKNFEELGAAYWKEASKKSTVTPEIKALADEITKDLTTPEKQANAIYLWVNKNIRYLSIIADRSGWIPHSASEILASRYGDCKDYTTILLALLKAKDIESYPVIIRSDFGEWFPKVAAPSYFNHAILYIPDLDLFADATAPNSRLGLITQLIVGKRAFLAGSKTGVIQTPADRPEDNQITSSVNIDLSPTGNVKARSTNAYVGRAELLFRPMLSDVSSSDSTFVTLILAFYGMNGKGKILKISDPFRVGEPFEVELEVELDDYTALTPNGSFRIPIGINLNSLASLADLVKEETRNTTLMLGALRLKESYRIKFPDGVTPQVPSNTSLSSSIGSFRSEFKLVDGQIEVVREVVISKDIISKAEYPTVREIFTKAADAFATEIKYTANRDLIQLKADQVAKQRPKTPVDPLDAVYDLFRADSAGAQAVSAREAKRLEAKLVADPADADARIKLVAFYSMMDVKDTAARKAARIRHRLWLIENRPDVSDNKILMFRLADLKREDAGYAILKNAWLKQIDANNTNSTIRINAFTFIKDHERDVAEGILREGQKHDPDNYELPLLLAQMYETAPDGAAAETDAQRSQRLKMLVDSGRVALVALKKERSDERDRARQDLLQTLADAAYEIGADDEAKTLATELILDFGQRHDDYGYDDATHIGNIILGRVALRQKDVAKAKEHLLIAIRAPLRTADSWLGEIDMRLAKELLAAGEKETVIEYLRLCEGLSNLTTEKKLFENQSKALKLWQQQIKQGKTPTFDFYKY